MKNIILKVFIIIVLAFFIVSCEGALKQNDDTGTGVDTGADTGTDTGIDTDIAPANFLTYTFDEEARTATVTGFDQASLENQKGQLRIPAEYEGYRVTAIGNDVFRECLFLEVLIIPGSIKTIPQNAFLGCSNLKKVTILDGVEKNRSAGFL